MWGGFRADVFSSLVHFFVMCASVFIVVVVALFEFGGWSFLRENLPSTHFNPMGTHSLPTTLVWGFIALSTLVDPNFYQRCFAAKSPLVAKRGILLCTVIWFLFDICTTLGGMYARAVYPDVQSHHGYLVLAMNLLPTGLKGFFIAGLVAIIVSTLDTYLIIASNTVSHDLVPKKFHTVNVHRVSVAFVAIVSILLSMYLEGSIREIWKTLGSYSAGCLLVPMLVGYLRPHLVKEKTFIAATLMGATAITSCRLFDFSAYIGNMEDLYVGIIFTTFTLLCGIFIEKKCSRALNV
jgi:SSS family solute:Na+ symporter